MLPAEPLDFPSARTRLRAVGRGRGFRKRSSTFGNSFCFDASDVDVVPDLSPASVPASPSGEALPGLQASVMAGDNFLGAILGVSRGASGAKPNQEGSAAPPTWRALAKISGCAVCEFFMSPRRTKSWICDLRACLPASARGCLGPSDVGVDLSPLVVGADSAVGVPPQRTASLAGAILQRTDGSFSSIDFSSSAI